MAPLQVSRANENTVPEKRKQIQYVDKSWKESNEALRKNSQTERIRNLKQFVLATDILLDVGH
jgi:hypothetical protein